MRQQVTDAIVFYIYTFGSPGAVLIKAELNKYLQVGMSIKDAAVVCHKVGPQEETRHNFQKFPWAVDVHAFNVGITICFH